MRRYRWLIGAGVALVVIVAGVVGFEVYASNFARSVSQSQAHTAVGTATPCGTPVSTTGLRTFQIVPAQTTVSYSVYEDLVLENKPNNLAVGTTHTEQGSFSIRTGADPLVASMNVSVDLRTLQTDSSRRDDFVRQNYLQTDQYPTATFVSTCASNLPVNYVDGETAHFQITGNLTLHGKTNKEVFDVQGKLVGNTTTGVATSTIYMTDFGIQPPNLANIAISQNKVLLTIDYTAQEG
ncbi:MAG TPA: YceI family protein [Ktedonobacterales bacterium]|nr:YceI family protein [Ktedonobacterales bacterium]